VDLTSNMSDVNAALLMQIAQTGMGEDEFADFFLRISGYAPGLDERVTMPLLAQTQAVGAE
jgi:hypothetical protein